jgi:mRNA-degrading endonuclease RelE of RelBE toxin-antitoxin system
VPPNYTRRFHTNDSIQVNLVDERIREYEQLLASRRTEDLQLREAIVQAVDILKETPEAGKHIANDRIPKEYTRRYGSGVNFWKYDILGSWRLIYTVGHTEGLILVTLVEWMSHADYERRFKY